MTSKILTFNEVIENDAKKTFSKRMVPAQPQEVGKEYVAPSDRQLAAQLSHGIATLQTAMDSASKAGLIVEPTFKSVSGRFNEFGVSIDSYICSVDIYRKLS